MYMYMYVYTKIWTNSPNPMLIQILFDSVQNYCRFSLALFKTFADSVLKRQIRNFLALALLRKSCTVQHSNLMTSQYVTLRRSLDTWSPAAPQGESGSRHGGLRHLSDPVERKVMILIAAHLVKSLERTGKQGLLFKTDENFRCPCACGRQNSLWIGPVSRKVSSFPLIAWDSRCLYLLLFATGFLEHVCSIATSASYLAERVHESLSLACQCASLLPLLVLLVRLVLFWIFF